MDQKPTFGFRKLSIGITSVMLGVTFFMAGGHTVFAETSSSQTTDTISNDKAKSTTSTSDTATEKTKLTTDPTVAAPTNTGDKASTETNTTDSAKQKTTSTTNSKVTPKLAVAAKLAVRTPTPATTNSDLAVTDDNGITLAINRNTVGNDGTDGAPININLSGTFQAGEVYSITVPVTTFGIDDSNFNNTIIVNRGVISKNDQTVDGQKYRNYKLTVSNDFTTTTGFKLVIPDGNNYAGKPAATSSNAIDPAGEVKREITWGYVDPDKGEVKNKSLYFTTIIKDSMHPTFNQVKPSPNKVTQLQTNTNYDFQLNINQTTGLQNDTSYGSNKVNSAVNMGTTITIPVPGDFVIDPDASLRASGLVPDGKTTITQEKAGADIVITVAAGTGSQNWTDATGYHLVGKFMQPVEPFDNKIYTADGKIKIDQKVRTVNGISTISAMIDQPWSVNLVGPKVTPKQGDLATQIVGNNGSNTLFQKQATNIVNYFGFTNDTSISFTNSLHIQVGFDENLAVTGIKTPDINATLRPGLTSYQYIIEVVDKATQKHRFITASVDAGQVIAAPTGTTIYKADILPNYVEVGATTKMGSDLSKISDSNSGSTTQNEDPDVFEAYGYISDKLNNMATLPPDTTVSTKIAIRSADFNDNQTANSAVDQKVLGLDSLTAAMQAYGYQNSTMYDPTNPTKSAGTIDMHFDTDSRATTVKVFEPIFYYVLPKYFSFSGGWDAIQDKAKDANTGKVIEPKFETYMVDGRQVVKLDYTGTGFNYNTNDSQSHDRLYITIDPDGVAGDYYYDAFVYTKSGMSHYTTKYTATNLDDQTKAFTKNITNSDIPGSLYKLSYLYGNRFTIKSPVIAYVPNMAQGNEDPKAAAKGTSDTKGDGTMYYYVNIANYDVNVIKDGRLLINVPLASDNSTSFDFTVDGPVTYDSSYDKTFDNSFTFYYANDVQRLPSTKEKGIQPSLDNYVTGDQVKDWSKVKSIIVKFSKDIPAADQIGRFVIKGHDPNFKSDAGKTGYIRVALTGSNFTPFVSTDTGIQIVGKSTIDTRLHYVDANGEDQYIEVPSMAKTYVENKDVMNLADFDPKNIPSTLIPENYELSSSIPSFIITNSDDEAQNAGFGKQVKYYFNGDIVQFELKHKTKSEAKTIQDTTYYEYDKSSSKYQANGTDDQNTIVVNGQKATPTSNTYSLKRVTDLVTGKATYYVVNTSTNESIAVDENGNFTIPGVKGLPSLSGYTANTADSTLAQTAKNYNINTLFAANPTTDQIVSKRVVHYIPVKQTLTYTMYNETQKKWITTVPIGFLNGKTDDDASGVLDALRKKVHDFLTPNAYKLDQIYYFDTGTGQQNIVRYDDSFNIDTGKLVAPGKFTGDPEKNNVILYVKDPVNYNKQTRAVSRIIYYHDADQNDKTLNHLPINPLPEKDYRDTIIQNVNYKRFEVTDAITYAILGYYKPSQMELVDGSWKPKAGESYIPYDASDQYSGFEIDTENGNPSKQGAVTNYDLSKYGYEGPVDENGNAFLKVAEAVPSVDGKSTIVNVYYHHKLVTIAPDKLPTAGEKVDASDPNSPVYPTNDYDPNAAASQSSVQRIIHHVYANGTKINGVDVSGQAVAGLSDTIQTVTFYKDATIDLVTGKITYTGKYRAVKSATTQNGTTISVPNYGQFAEVTSPSIANYMPVDAAVDSANANLGDALKTVNVAYIADHADAIITYIDADNYGSTIIADPMHGSHGSEIKYSTADKIKELVAKGYELVTDGYSDDTSKKYFDTSKVQKWTVTMRHKKLVIDPNHCHANGDKLTTPGYQGTYPQGVDKSDLNRTVSRKIKFQYAHGTTWAGKDLSGQPVVDDQGQKLEDIDQTVSYQRQATIDLVKLADPAQAKNAVTYGDWHVKTGSNPDFASVDVLPVAGYEASQATVKEKTPTIDPVNGPEDGETEVVLYSPISQSVKVQFVDKNGNVIEPEYTFSGLTGQTVKVDPIKPPMGWKLVDPKTVIPTDVSFGRTPLPNIRIEIEHATVHLEHNEWHEANTGTLPDNSIRPFPAGVDKDDLNQTVTRTIRVHMPDGKTIKSMKQVLSFTRGATIDEINGNVTYDKWTPLNGTMEAVKVTDIVATPAGYSPTLEAVKLLTGVDPNDQDTIVDISYEPNTQNAQLKIVDDDALVDGQPKELFTTSSSGKFGTNVYFDNLKDELDKLTNENYQVDMSGLPGNSTYQADDNNNNFVIHVKHKTAPATGYRDIREKISYVYVDKNGVEHTIHSDYITDAANRVVFIQNGTLDLVTDTYTWQHDWTSTTGKFVRITSPEIHGYVVQPGMEAVPAQEVAIDGENGDKISVVNDQLGGKIAQTNTDPYVQAWVISYKIYYNAAPQSTKVTYVDDDEQGKEIRSNEITGHTFDTVATGIANPDSTKYDLVDSDNLPDEIVFSTTGYPKITVHVKHKHEQVN
ncbi:mucin-binding protein, partial [Lactobacillus johnsonii]|uniref:mucin-binding protein n=1 Tax=Lactobacillus johnsonii TaxID=33959 RepID=UPI0022E06591